MPIPALWTFRSRVVAKGFDRHVREQLPWYDLATSMVAHIANHYIGERGIVVDVGASTGNIARALARTVGERCVRFVAIDASKEMLEQYRGPGITVEGRAQDYVFENADLVIAFLVLMFVPVPERATLIENMKRALRPGGAIIVFDKVEPREGYIGTVMSRFALAAKYAAGANADEVIEKELSLAGAQRPLSEIELRGFVEVFRVGDFAGFVYEGGIA